MSAAGLQREDFVPGSAEPLAVTFWARGLLVVALLHGAWGEEGFWCLQRLPAGADQAWLQHVSHRCVRIMDVHSSGSGSIVSPEGLVMTNRHVIRGQLDRLSWQIGRQGYRPLQRLAELPCPDLQVYRPLSDEDVSRQVLGATRPEMSLAQAEQARLEALQQLEAASSDAQVEAEVSLVRATTEYRLHRYRVYSDVRLVYAPPAGQWLEPYSTLFPHSNLDFDVAFLRLYQNEQPLATPEPLRLEETPADPGQAVVLTGFPGFSDRALGAQGVDYRRRVLLPLRLAKHSQQLATLNTYRHHHPVVADPYWFLLASAVGADRLQLAYAENHPGSAGGLPELSQALASAQPLELRRIYQDLGPSILVEWSLCLAQRARPTLAVPQRRLRQLVLSTQEVCPEVEELLLSHALQLARAALGKADPFVIGALQGREPRTQAQRLVQRTELDSLEVRRWLWDHPRAILASPDPLLGWALSVSRLQSAGSREYATKVGSCWAALAYARQLTYPDADGSFRVSFGKLITGPSPYGLASDCDATHGSSGSPVLRPGGGVLGVAAREDDRLSGHTFRGGTVSGLNSGSIVGLLKGDGMEWLVSELQF